MKVSFQYRIVPFFVALWVLLISCQDEDSCLQDKWQLRTITYPQGAVLKVDSIFYNFQKSSFMLIGLQKEGIYSSFLGTYILTGNEICVTLLPEYENKPYYDRFVGWKDGERIFKVEQCCGSKMILNHEDTLYTFRRY